ncbi:MAG TPA: CBS domain-containing protein [Lachnospiraceae bacterium]|nr:CBS domain-containing protein [Lachnospiraceae bacterium]
MNILFFLKPKHEVAVVYDDYTLRQVLETMEYHRYATIPVLHRDGRFVGCLSEGDLLWHIKEMNNLNLREAEKIPISQVRRNRDYESVRVTEKIENLINKATSQNFVPVVDDQDYFIGIVTRSDIISYCYEQLKACGLEGRTSHD